MSSNSEIFQDTLRLKTYLDNVSKTKFQEKFPRSLMSQICKRNHQKTLHFLSEIIY
jgi:hypothetical protein